MKSMEIFPLVVLTHKKVIFSLLEAKPKNSVYLN